MKIQYKNVCSIRAAEVVFNKGELICIKGESNQGKSALFYALVDGLTNNKTFKNWINNKALEENPKSCAWIGLFDDEGNEFQVEAGVGHMYYRHNNAKYEKVGRKSIFEIIQGQIPGLLYDPEEPNQILNVVGEDSGMFPIDRSDPQIFKTYERLLSLSCTQDITRTIKQDLEDIDYKCSDMLKSVNKSQDTLNKIDATLKSIDENKLRKIQCTLQAYLDTYNRLCSIYNSIKSTNDYVNKVLSVDYKSIELFDINKASSIFNSLSKANSLHQYCMLSEVQMPDTIEFDTNKIISIGQTYNIAKTLNEDISILNKEIEKDTSTLNEINSILSSIKICPLCGKPMEE